MAIRRASLPKVTEVHTAHQEEYPMRFKAAFGHALACENVAAFRAVAVLRSRAPSKHPFNDDNIQKLDSTEKDVRASNDHYKPSGRDATASVTQRLVLIRNHIGWAARQLTSGPQSWSAKFAGGSGADNLSANKEGVAKQAAHACLH
jgi:hypothetical protein